VLQCVVLQCIDLETKYRLTGDFGMQLKSGLGYVWINLGRSSALQWLAMCCNMLQCVMLQCIDLATKRR